MRRTTVFAAVVTTLSLATTCCGGSSSPSSPTPTTTTTTPPATTSTWTIEGALLTETAAGFPGRSIADVAAIRLLDGRWRLLFAAANFIHSAISPDGLSLTMEPGIRIDPASTLGPLALAASVKLLRLDDGRIRAYFFSVNAMYSAISSDEAATFTIEPGVRLLASAIGDTTVHGGSVVRMRDGRWRMYFSGSHREEVLSASSSDLLSWTLDPGARIGAGATLTGKAVHPCAILNADGSVSIFYFRSNPVGTWTATSTDGLAFSSETNIFAGPTPARADPDVVQLPDGSLRMYFNIGDNTSGTIYAARRSASSLFIH